jgi:hypothetical protein
MKLNPARTLVRDGVGADGRDGSATFLAFFFA